MAFTSRDETYKATDIVNILRELFSRIETLERATAKPTKNQEQSND